MLIALQQARFLDDVSNLEAKEEEGFRAPFATARICDPSEESKVQITSLSPSLVRRSTKALTLYEREAIDPMRPRRSQNDEFDLDHASNFYGP